jgi:3-hydroxyacyl-CoA dehydrogenase
MAIIPDHKKTMEKIAIIGSGLIGRAWAMVFARAGHQVTMYDTAPGAVSRAIDLVEEGLVELKNAGLIDDAPADIVKRISAGESLADAVGDADYVQENTSEKLDVKREVFRMLDEAAPPHCILASSTSTIRTSRFSEGLEGKHRCIVAHPVNPPHVVPIVEVSPAPWTAPEVVEKTRALHEKIGQVPIIVKKEVEGFILNRLQAALLRESWRLVDEGYVTVDDVDKTIRDGLGLRWAFMGPFETIDLNAPGGISEYAAIFGTPYHQMMDGVEYKPWDDELISRIEAQRRERMPHDQHAEREAWRDRRLMALVAHKRAMNERDD